MRRFSTLGRLTAMLLALMFLIAGCGGANRASKPAPSGSGAPKAADQKPVIVLQGVDPTTLDPHNHTETAASNVLSNIYDSLIERNEKMELVPGLAETWKVLDDNTWEFTLRKGVKFHDGTEFTAEDVKFSIERILRDGFKRRGYLAPIKEVKILDPYKFQIITSAPYPILPNRLAEEHMVSKKYATEKGEEALIKSPMGTGAYKFVKWVKDEQIELVANENYWKGAPAIKHVIFKPVPEAQTRIAQLQSGQADIIVNIPANQVENVKKSDVATVAEVPSVRVVYVDVASAKGGILANQKFRQAMAHAIDMDALLKNVLLGNGYKVNSALTPQHFGYVESMEPTKYDPELAKKLLAESGYNGEEIPFDTPNGRYAMDKEMAEAIAGQLSKIGIKVKLQVNEWGNHSKMANAREAKGLFLLGWGNNTWDADGTLESEFGSKGTVSLTNDPELDKLIYGARAIIDQNKRREMYKQALQRIQDQAYHIANWRQKDVYGVSKRLDWMPRSDERISLFSAKLKQ
jgi:peptide/nickel transport system substrate-binding protein